MPCVYTGAELMLVERLCLVNGNTGDCYGAVAGLQCYNVIMGASHNIISLPRAWRPGIQCTGGQFYYPAPACSPRNIGIGGVFG